MPDHVVVDLGSPLGPPSEPVVRRAPITDAEQADFNARLAAEPARVAAFEKITANYSALQQHAQQALQANAAFLALTPAQQQIQAGTHLARLTQQSSVLIRLVLGALESTAGTG